MLPILAVVAAVALVGVLFAEILRVERSQRALTESALHDYAEVAAWQFVRRAEPELRTSLLPALAPFHEDGAARSGPAALLVEARAGAERCPCPFGTAPDLAFRFDGEDLATAGDGGVVAMDALRSHLAARLAGFDGGEPPEDSIHLLDGPDGPAVVATVVRRASPATVAGYAADAGPLGELFASVRREHHLLPPALLDREEQARWLALKVTGAGRTLHESGDTAGAFRGRAAFAGLGEFARVSNLSVEAWLDPAAADSLLVGGVPRSRLPLLGGLLLLALLLAAVAAGQHFAQRRLMRLRTETIARVAHELRTPLTQIRVFTDTLRLGRARDDAERERALAVVDRETRRLEHLVHNVLRFGEGEAGELDCRPLDAGGFVRELAEEFAPLAEHYGVRLDTDVRGAPEVRADAGALRRILLNLLDNAGKHSPAGGRVTLRARPGGAGTVVFSVSDEGPGVSPAERERIWRMYGRGNSTSGSGIGLAVVRRLAAAQGGRAWVEDRPGGGARFAVSLPAAGAA